MATFTKPIEVPRWADDDVNNAEPSEAKKDLGWIFGEEPPSATQNWHMQLIGAWWQWINERWDDGVDIDEVRLLDPDTTNPMMNISATRVQWLSAAGIEWASAVGVFTAGRSITDGINLKGIGNVKDIEFDGTLNRMSYDVSTDIWSLFNNSATASMTVSETLISLKKPVTLDANDDVTVSGTGQYKHGEFKQTFSAAAAFAGPNITFDLTTGSAVIGANSTECVIPITLPVGKRIKAIDYFVFGQSTTSKSLSLLFTTAASTAHSTVSAVTDASSGIFTKTVSGLTHTVVAGQMYWLEMQSASDATLDGFAGAEITFDEP